MPITITVQDNATPTINDQSISGVNENSSDGTNAGSITATHSEGNALTFTTFTLAGLKIDGSNVALSSYGGTSQATETDAAGKLLRAELLNVGKIADTERIYIKVFDATRATMPTFPDVDADDTVCVLSNGNPIIDLNDNQFSFTVDKLFKQYIFLSELFSRSVKG